MKYFGRGRELTRICPGMGSRSTDVVGVDGVELVGTIQTRAADSFLFPTALTLPSGSKVPKCLSFPKILSTTFPEESNEEGTLKFDSKVSN